VAASGLIVSPAPSTPTSAATPGAPQVALASPPPATPSEPTTTTLVVPVFECVDTGPYVNNPGHYPGPGDPAHPKRIGSATLVVSAAKPLPTPVALYVSPVGRAVALAPAGSRCEEPNYGGEGLGMTVTSTSGTVTFERPNGGAIAMICSADPDGRRKLAEIGWDLIGEQTPPQAISGAEAESQCGTPGPSIALPGGAFGIEQPGDAGAIVYTAVSPWSWQNAPISMERYTCTMKGSLEAICRLGQRVAFDPSVAIKIDPKAVLRSCLVTDVPSQATPTYETAAPAALPSNLPAVDLGQGVFGIDAVSGFWAAPANWGCGYLIGQNESSGLTLYEGLLSDEFDQGFPSIRVSDSGGMSLAGASDIACPWFPGAGAIYSPPQPCGALPKGFKVERLSSTLVRYRGPSTDTRAPSGSVVAGLVQFELGPAPYAREVRCEVPGDRLDICAGLALDGQPVLATGTPPAYTSATPAPTEDLPTLTETPQPTALPAAAPQVLANFGGSGDKLSEAFSASGDSLELHYHFDCSSAGMAMPFSVNLLGSGASYPAVQDSGKTNSGTTTVRLGGTTDNYRLEVSTGYGCSWSVQALGTP